MTLSTVTYDTATHKIVPIKPTEEMRKACSRDRYWNEIDKEWESMIAAAPEYQDTCTDGGKCGAGGYCKDCIQEPTKDE